MADPNVVAAFGAGMISFASPCVLPLVPGYLSLMSGLSASEIAEARGVDQRRVLRATLLFVAGFTVVFVALGAAASAIGGALYDHQRGLNQITGVLVIVMGLFLIGVASPRVLMAERRLHVSPSRLGPWAAPVMGMAFAFGWTPCIGPVLSGVLTAAANEATIGKGVGLLLVYSAGLGVPFVLSGLAMGRLTGAFGWMKRHARAINVVSGVLLATFGLLLATNRISDVSATLVEFMDRIGLSRLTAI